MTTKCKRHWSELCHMLFSGPTVHWLSGIDLAAVLSFRFILF